VALVSRSGVVAFALLALAAPAVAGPPGTWTQVTNLGSQGVNTDEVSLARTGDGTLHVLWAQDQDNSVLNTRIAADAQSVVGTSTVFTYAGSVGDVVLLPAPGGLRAFFAGLSAGDPHDGGLSTAVSPDGVTWSVQPTLASQETSGNEASPVYAAAGIGGTSFNNGTPLAVWGVASPGTQGYHVGTDPSTPDVRFGAGAVSVYAPEAATDSATGQVAIGWTELDAGETRVAYVQASASPWFPLGAPMTAPGAQAADGSYPVGMTGRSGGADGIYVSYLRGDNQFNGEPSVWRIGATSATTLSRADGRFPGIAMGADGRLWAFWSGEASGAIHARRSDPDASSWGAPVTVKPPSGTSSIWSLKGEGTGLACGALDLVALVSAGDDTANFHQRVLPGLTLEKKILNGKMGKKQKVRFTTSDAGAPVDAIVKFGAKQASTGDDGKAKLAIKRKRKARKVAATASDDCYNAAKLRVKITKKPAG